MDKTTVIYWSRTGNTEAMAKMVARGLQDGGVKTTLLRVSEADVSVVEQCDSFAFGCPAMGKEVLEEKEFEPFFAEIEKRLKDKPVALFGSYGWGDGRWMRDWQARVTASGAGLFEQGLIFQVESPLVTKIKRAFGKDKKPDEAACLAFGTRFAAHIIAERRR
ncbi:MAG: flavodoxin [Clostridiales Family XIII bacterium]|jgi:flavodoxin short chain|nr:flavodoxin [Clostridiales Family XIII bacterium]